MNPRFHYVLVIPDPEPDEFSPFQGVTRGLLGFDWALHLIARSPPDLFGPALPRPAQIGRRVAGSGGFKWTPLHASVLPDLGQLGDQSIWIFFSQDEVVATQIEGWRRDFDPTALHVSSTGVAGALRPDEFTRKVLRRAAERAVRARTQDPIRANLLDAIARWRPPVSQRSPLSFFSHNVTAANEMVMALDGFQPKMTGPHLNPNTDEDYVFAIEQSAERVRFMRGALGDVPAFSAYPPRPDTVVFAPAMYREVYGRLSREEDEPLPGLHDAMRELQSQTGYAFRGTRTGAFMSPGWEFIMGLRTAELHFLTAAIGMYAASNVAAAVRLPAGVNRIQGTVSQLASHIRAHPETERKTARVFSAVQEALAKSVAPELVRLIGGSQTGIKLVSDAPLEWLSIDGLPMSIRHQVSRINATPASLTIGELAASDPLMLKGSAFREVLVISSFNADDPIKDHLRAVLAKTAPLSGLSVRVAEVTDAQSFKDALNRFGGAIAVFDGHGTHDPKTGLGALVVGSEQLSVWDLRGEVRFPPVMILSACDTHALDRSHVTVGNALLACGVRAVLATLLPVRSMHSATFVAWLLQKAIAAESLISGRGQALTWAEVVTSALRSQLVLDVVQPLSETGALTQETAERLITTTSFKVTLGDRGWWETLKSDLARETGWASDQLDDHLQRQIACSDVVRYVHLGDPEAIIISERAILDTLNGLPPRPTPPRTSVTSEGGGRRDRRGIR